MDCVNAFKVSISVPFCSINVCRCDLDAATLMAESNDSISMVWRVSGWLCNVGMSQVSHFTFLHYFGIDTLDLDVDRLDLDSTTSLLPSNESNDSVQTFQIILGWLRSLGMYLVSLFDFSHWIDVYRCDLDTAASTPETLAT